MKINNQLELLLSLPPHMAEEFSVCEPRIAADAFATFDPPDRQLGSGGGTAHVLSEAWNALGAGSSFADWLNGSRKLIIHGGGQSRRLPAYAGAGKLFIPVPVYRWAVGQRVDQTLLDMQLPLLKRIASKASEKSRTMIVSGDVLLRSEAAIPELPDADVVLFGLWTTPEQASHFGVMFCPHGRPGELTTFLQKPDPDTVRKMGRDSLFMIDVGLWLLSERAVQVLMKKCGWQGENYQSGAADTYDLYGNWALGLGTDPVGRDEEVSSLSVAVVPLPDGGFYHYGKSRDIIESSYELQNLVVDQTRIGSIGMNTHPRQFVQNAQYRPVRGLNNIWIENSVVPESWRLESDHVLTGVPENDWKLALRRGDCLDFAPIGGDSFAVRFYGMDDAFRGPLDEKGTCWLGRPAADWFVRRGLEDCLDGADLQDAPLFPVLNPAELTQEFMQWLLDAEPEASAAFAGKWRNAERVSAQEISRRINLERLYAQRRRLRAQALPRMAANADHSVFHKLDLNATAEIFAAEGLELPPRRVECADPLVGLHDCMFRAAVLRKTDPVGAEAHEAEAFATLKQAIVGPLRKEPVRPRCTLLEDQIVWGRSPIRLDLAGGWSDTPPYCFEFGGRVLNMAVDLNGQPPIQVYAKCSAKKEIVIRSIDLGIGERLTTYEEIAQYDQLGCGFSIVRAALALCGFSPEFNGGLYPTLAAQLDEFGGGLEISMLAAIPKGSGLGTSSVLAATLLGTLSDLCGLGWDRLEIMRRTSALEQLLTSGGGWQDQVGGLLPGAKLIETQPGLEQEPVVRYLPEHCFGNSEFKSRALLYYTGITRTARNILADIVRGIFLNSRRHLDVIDEISRNAKFAYDAFLRNDLGAIEEAIRQSWALNCQLDSGTNPPETDAILARISDRLAAMKLLGAGGGGYMLMLAKDAEAAQSIRRELQSNPPNSRARFVAFSLSGTGFQTTRS